MNWKEKLEEWRSFAELDQALKKRLSNDREETLQDQFYRYLEFGTGGMRGELGAGINRMNVYTIKRVALGLALYIKNQGLEAMAQGVVISYDNRHQAQLFAEWTARILASKDIRVYLSDKLRPTPELSFLVREYQAFSGVMITASHNPKEYNGFKVYGQDGGQITLETAAQLMDILASITNELEISAKPLQKYLDTGKVCLFSVEADKAYIKQLQTVIQDQTFVREYGAQLRIVYSPLHGTGMNLIQKALTQFGFMDFIAVPEQIVNDPDFSTVRSPNPEEAEAFDLALDLARKQKADLVLATDPDADRLGAVILKNDEPIYLNGNQIGVLMLDYLLRKKSVQEDMASYFLAKTIVTSELGAKMAAKYLVETRNTLTGFKFIGEQIELAEKYLGKKFLFGYEESYGYLVEPFVRDKDAVQAAILLAEAALESKVQGKTLADRLCEIYQEFGFFKESLESKEFKGQNGMKQMEEQMEQLRTTSSTRIGGFQIAKKEDYLAQTITDYSNGMTDELTLPKSNVLKFVLDNEDWVCIRPSGTEPKLKIYYSVNDDEEELAKSKLQELRQAFHKLIDTEEK